MNMADAVVSGGVALAISVISWAVKALFARDRDRAAARKDSSDAFARERETWRQDYDHAYDQVKAQCDECVQELHNIRDAFHRMLDDLEDQIVPMLMIPGTDPQLIRDAMRAISRRSREMARHAGKENSP